MARELLPAQMFAAKTAEAIRNHREEQRRVEEREAERQQKEHDEAVEQLRQQCHGLVSRAVDKMESYCALVVNPNANDLGEEVLKSLLSVLRDEGFELDKTDNGYRISWHKWLPEDMQE